MSECVYGGFWTLGRSLRIFGHLRLKTPGKNTAVSRHPRRPSPAVHPQRPSQAEVPEAREDDESFLERINQSLEELLPDSEVLHEGPGGPIPIGVVG